MLPIRGLPRLEFLDKLNAQFLFAQRILTGKRRAAACGEPGAAGEIGLGLHCCTREIGYTRASLPNFRFA